MPSPSGAREADKDRRVTCRPAPEVMAQVSALLPAGQGVAVYAALVREAQAARSRGDERTRAQLMADILVERVTGQAVASEVPVEVSLVMTDEALLGDSVEPAQLEGYGPVPVPAPLARQAVRELPDHVGAWLRRLYARPATRQLVAMESRRRLFAGALRRLVVTRDQRCRTPWCDAPVPHVDHVLAVASGGSTAASNAQGLCEACNLIKESPGWRSAARPGGLVETSTPTGHLYASRPPPLPATARSDPGTTPAVPRIDWFYASPVTAA